MSFLGNKQLYYDLIRQVIVHEVGVSDFVNRFISLWRADRDEQQSGAAMWPERFDVQLIVALDRQEIDRQEFEDRWASLWNYSSDVPFCRMVDAIHSACYSYTDSPELPWELDEQGLLEIVMAEKHAYDDKT